MIGKQILGLGLIFAVLGGCAASDDDPLYEALPVSVKQVALANAAGMRSKQLENARSVPGPTEAELGKSQAQDGRGQELTPAQLAAEVLQWVEIELATGKVTEHTFDRRAALELSRMFEAEGLANAGSEGGAPAEASRTKKHVKGEARAQEKTWSNATDSRFRMGVADGFPANDNYLNPIGRITYTNSTGGTSACSGVRVGRQVVMTAGHCVVEQNHSPPNIWANLTFIPRNDTTSTPTQPYGTRPMTSVWTPAQYWNGTCTTVADCNKYDIAFAVTQNGFGSGGWYGYRSGWSASTIQTYYTYHNGYPGCGTGSAPASCTSGTAYGDDNSDCDVGGGSNFSLDANSQHREMSFKCDGSPGQSGAPLFSEVPTCGKCVWGVYNQYPSSCEIGSKCNIAYPNVMGRMTSEWGAVLATIKASNPD